MIFGRLWFPTRDTISTVGFLYVYALKKMSIFGKEKSVKGGNISNWNIFSRYIKENMPVKYLLQNSLNCFSDLLWRKSAKISIYAFFEESIFVYTYILIEWLLKYCIFCVFNPRGKKTALIIKYVSGLFRSKYYLYFLSSSLKSTNQFFFFLQKEILKALSQWH